MKFVTRLKTREVPVSSTGQVTRLRYPIWIWLVCLPAAEGDDADSQVIKSMLAITKSSQRQDERTEPYHIVAKIHSPKNMAIARMVGKREVKPLC